MQDSKQFTLHISPRQQNVAQKRYTLYIAPANNQQLNIPLTVQECLYPGAPTQGINRTAELVNVGVPLPKGSGITSESQLGVNGASAAQFRVLGRWPSGEVKWVQVSALCDLDAGRQKQISLTMGSGNFGGANLGSDAGDHISVDAGIAQFTIKKAGFNLFDSVVVNGKQVISSGSQGLLLNGPAYPNTIVPPATTEYTSANDSHSTAVIEQNGPVMCVVRIEAALRDASGNLYLRTTTRLRFVKGKSHVSARVHLINADEGESNTFQSAYKGFQSFTAQLNLAQRGKNFSVGTESSPVSGSFSGEEAAGIYQAYSNSLEKNPNYNAYNGHPEIKSFIARTQTPCSCNSTWTYAQSGYQVTDGPTLLHSGDCGKAPQGWADVSDASGCGVQIGVYEMAANWPKALSFTPSSVHIDIWPDQTDWQGTGAIPYYVPWPNQWIADLFFNFHDQALVNPADEFLKWQHPLLARADAAHYNLCGVFPYPILDPAKEDAYYRANGLPVGKADIPPVNVRWYQWGDGGGGNQAEQRFAYLMWFLQRGFAGYYTWAMNHYRFMLESWAPAQGYNSHGIPFYWRNHTPSGDLDSTGWPQNVVSLNKSNFLRLYGDANQHPNAWGLCFAYLMTGDEGLKDFIYGGFGDRWLWQGDSNHGYNKFGGLTNTRGVGQELQHEGVLADFFNTIGDSANRDLCWNIADNIINLDVKPYFALNGFGSHTVGTSYVRGIQHGPGDINNDCCDGSGRNVHLQQKPFMNAIYAEGMYLLAWSHGPNWPSFGQTMDYAAGAGMWSVLEGFIWGPTKTRNDSGVAYCMDLENPNPNVKAGYGQTTWMNYAAMHWFVRDTAQWQPAHVIAEYRGFPTGLHSPEYGLPQDWAAIDPVVNPDGLSIQRIPVQATNLGGGEWKLSFTLPPNFVSVRAKFDAKQIVDWIGYDSILGKFTGDPANTTAWVAATEITIPDPVPGQNQLTVQLGNGPSYNISMRAVVK